MKITMRIKRYFNRLKHWVLQYKIYYLPESQFSLHIPIKTTFTIEDINDIEQSLRDRGLIRPHEHFKQWKPL